MTWNRVGWGVATGLASALLLLTLAGYGGAFAWQLENLGALRVPLFWAAVLGLLVALIGRRWLVLGLCGLALVLNASAFVPLYFGRERLSDPPQLRAMLMNVRYGNSDYARVFEAIRAADPDVLLLSEVSMAWGEQLEALRADYPYALIEPRGDTFGIAYFSRLDPTSLELQHFGLSRLPSMVATHEIDGRPFTILATHPYPPTKDAYVESRNDQLTAIADYLHGIEGARMLFADINLTSDSARFRALCERAGLRDSRQGFGIQGSWPVWRNKAWHGPLRIAIDHCLVSEEIRVHDRRLGMDVGSDHYPVVVEVSVN